MNKKNFAFRTAIKECLICGNTLTLVNTRDLERKKFCSPKCRTDGLIGKSFKKSPLNQIRKCLQCGIDFISNAKIRKFCSQKCNGYYNYKKGLTRGKNNTLESHIKRLLVYKGRKHFNLDQILRLYEKQQGCCALSGIKMTWDRDKGRVNTNLSIDRISSHIGYTEENIQLVCRIVNIMKNNIDNQEFIELCRKIGG